jgi:glutamate decarboxylase
VPAYTFPKNREDLAVLRVVVRNGFSADLAELFLGDLEHLIPQLERQPQPLRDESAKGFHH